MPGSVPKDVTGFTMGPRELARREPACMAMVAAVAVAWTELERTLAFLVGNALGASEKLPFDTVRTAPNWVARVAIENAETIRTKIKFSKAVVRPMLEGTDFLDQWSVLERRLQDRADERNRIVHAQWAVSEKLPGELVRMRPSGNECWRVKDFKEALGRFADLQRNLLEFSHALGSAKAAGTLKNPF